MIYLDKTGLIINLIFYDYIKNIYEYDFVGFILKSSIIFDKINYILSATT